MAAVFGDSRSLWVKVVTGAADGKNIYLYRDLIGLVNITYCNISIFYIAPYYSSLNNFSQTLIANAYPTPNVNRIHIINFSYRTPFKGVRSNEFRI